MIFRPIGENGRIKQFSTTGALPGVKRPDKIIEFFGKHATVATWTMH
jgi:hypothetical protein